MRDRSGYEVNINAGRVTVGYLNQNGEPVKFVKPKRDKAMDKEMEDFPLYDIETAVAEMDRDADADLLKQGRSYVRMSDQQFTDRSNALAAHGEAIIEEEERARS